jgi:hypothetical protein
MGSAKTKPGRFPPLFCLWIGNLRLRRLISARVMSVVLSTVEDTGRSGSFAGGESGKWFEIGELFVGEEKRLASWRPVRMLTRLRKSHRLRSLRSRLRMGAV